MARKRIPKLSEFKDPFRKLEPGEDDGWDPLRRRLCTHVVEVPIMAGYKQPMDDGCLLEYPTLAEAKKWLKDNPK